MFKNPYVIFIWSIISVQMGKASPLLRKATRLDSVFSLLAAGYHFICSRHQSLAGIRIIFRFFSLVFLGNIFFFPLLHRFTGLEVSIECLIYANFIAKCIKWKGFIYWWSVISLIKNLVTSLLLLLKSYTRIVLYKYRYYLILFPWSILEIWQKRSNTDWCLRKRRRPFLFGQKHLFLVTMKMRMIQKR